MPRPTPGRARSGSSVSTSSRTGLSRRELLCSGGALLGGLALAPRALFADQVPGVSAEASAALDKSRLVYISPLHPDGAESRCHAEVWFFIDRGDIVIGTDRERWKARALTRGWDRARLWVGDFGPVARAAEQMRKAPNFEARAQFDTERGTFDRLLASFAKRYSSEWSKWGPRFEKSYADGSRVLIRYAPVISR